MSPAPAPVGREPARPCDPTGHDPLLVQKMLFASFCEIGGWMAYIRAARDWSQQS